VTLTTATLVVFTGRALARAQDGRDRRGDARVYARVFAFLGLPFAIAAAFAHVSALTALLPPLFPVGFVLGFAGAVASLFVPSARRAFAALSDGDVRLMLSFRAIYGALLFGLAGVGIFPSSFALTAGLGDLAVGWLALAAPRSLASDGPRLSRLVIHGLGALDLFQVAVLAATVVRPWSAAHGDVTDTMTLPWVGVPLMLAVNLHGVWQACARREPAAREPRPEPLAHVRGAHQRT